MSSKRIVSFEPPYEVPSRSLEKKREMLFKTEDGWYYKYVAFGNDEPFRFKCKRRPNLKISDDEVTPKTIAEFVEDHPQLEFVDCKTIYFNPDS